MGSSEDVLQVQAAAGVIHVGSVREVPENFAMRMIVMIIERVGVELAWRGSMRITLFFTLDAGASFNIMLDFKSNTPNFRFRIYIFTILRFYVAGFLYSFVFFYS